VKDGRWVTIADSQFVHEKEGLAAVKQALPDAAPFRAWANFEFRDNRGRWHEVDLLVLARDTLYLVELKHYRGILRGNDHVWMRDGHRAEDSPLLLARRKAQYFASLLKDAIRQRGGPEATSRIPFVQELVFLHHEQFVCDLPPASRINLYGLDGRQKTSGLPGISERLLAPARRDPITEQNSQLIAGLMKAIGLTPRRQREVGSWIIDDQPLGDGDGWQDWPAFHHVNTEDHARIRFYTTAPGATSADVHAHRQAVTHEYNLLSRLTYDGLQAPKDLVNEPELGIGLVFGQPKADTPLDLWLAEHKDTLTLTDQLDLIGQIADIVYYAHRNRVVHRTLNPRAIAIRERGKHLLPQVTDWDSAGVLPANPDTEVSRLSSGSLSLMAGTPSDTAKLFAAPEGQRPTDTARIDVFGLGALAFYILTGGIAPATERGELLDRLRRDRGLDLAAELPQVRTSLRKLVLDATHPSPAERIPDVADFVAQLAEIKDDLLEKSTGTDPLEATPGTELDGRFLYKRRLGAGSTAVGILVTDHHAGEADRVLKVAKDPEAAERLRAEAQILARLDNDERIVTLHGVVQVGPRTALILQNAGRTTLAEELSNRHRLSIDVQQRWGTDLLTALIALERQGIMHRDIKPSNLGVHQSNPRADSHLMMFDFSMVGVDPRNIEAGTPPYLDPFLGTGNRSQYDSAAERYGAAVVLFEMSTGSTPQYGPDRNANPVTVDDDITLTPALFEPSLAPAIIDFFAGALSRDATKRPDTAEDMLRAWRRVFDVSDIGRPTEADDALAEKADATTPLTAAGLSIRAVSALAPVAVTTVGELLALDSTALNRLVAREAKDTSKEIKDRYRSWAARLGKQKQTPANTLMGLDDAISLLIAAVSGQRASTRKDAAELILGITPGLDAFASSTELAHHLGKATQRGPQLIAELQADWGANAATRELLDAVIEIARRVIADYGGVAAVTTLTAEIRARLPHAPLGAGDTQAHQLAERAAGGLLRAALDRLTEHEKLDGDKQLARRRHDRRLALLAEDERLLAAADAAAKRANELVSVNLDAVIAPSTAARELQSAFQAGFDSVSDEHATAPLPSDSRLIRLAAAIAKHAAVSGRSELHNVNMSPSVAVETALTGLAQTEALAPSQIRSRVLARFPGNKVPPRPQLDALLARTSLKLKWDNETQTYHFPDTQPDSATTMHTRTPTGLPTATGPSIVVDEDGATGAATLNRSLGECGFVAIGVPISPDRPGEHERVAQHLAEGHGGQVVDVTGRLIAAMRSFAEQQGVSWDLVRGADAADATPLDASGLRAVIDRVVPQLWAELQAAVFDSETNSAPLILTEVSPLARYGHLDVLAKLSDLAAPRRRPVWVVLPQLRGQTGALVDRKPIQLGTPGGQFVLWRGMPAGVDGGALS